MNNPRSDSPAMLHHVPRPIGRGADEATMMNVRIVCNNLFTRMDQLNLTLGDLKGAWDERRQGRGDSHE